MSAGAAARHFLILVKLPFISDLTGKKTVPSLSEKKNAGNRFEKEENGKEAGKRAHRQTDTHTHTHIYTYAALHGAHLFKHTRTYTHTHTHTCI